MSEKRFTIQSTATELELYDYGKQIGEFTHHEFVARSVDYVVDLLNSLSDENRELKEEDARLNQVIINLHDELRKLTEQNRKLKNIVMWQQEIIANYNELMQMVSSD